PYEGLIEENARRGKHDPEYELVDTGAFDDDRYWIVEVHYAKATPLDVLMTVQVTNAGPAAETLHVLPTAWFRNTWAWDVGGALSGVRAVATDGGAGVEIDHPFLGSLELIAAPGPSGALPPVLVCHNETNTHRLYGDTDGPRSPKDAINDHIVHGL